MNNLPITVFWFRRDLRLVDNHGLFHALQTKYPVLPIFIFDKNILDNLTKSDRRVSFIQETLTALDENLRALGSSLFVIHDTPVSAFKTICSSFDVREVVTNHDYEPYALQRDKQVSDLLASGNIPFRSFKDQVIFERSDVVKSDGSPYTVFTPYSRAWKQEYKKSQPAFYNTEKWFHHFFKTRPFDVPSLSQLGFNGENTGVSSPVIDKEVIALYDKTRNIPHLDGTSKLSVHLRFGTVCIRQLVALANEINERWLNEMIWREFFMMILYHFPRVIHESFKREYDNIQWKNDEKEFRAWCNGETGYPIVDAGMRQLNQTGFMHNRVRMIVASFLTKHLLIDWRWGEAYFADKLLDYELASNNGNWQWAAGCGCDAAPYFRIFSPAVQTKRFDPEFLYIKKWIPNFPSYNVSPIVDHEVARNRALSVYSKALKRVR
jgi:deoxyribodipyrimidine photo-lyase